MIAYERDPDKTHDATIKTLLRTYNAKYSNNTDTDCIYLYRVASNRLTGALTVGFFWDWAAVKAFYYKDKEVLKALVEEACDYYKDKAKGMKFYTPSKKHLDDFKAVGFTDVSTYTYPDGTEFFFADLKHASFPASSVSGVHRYSEPKKPYQAIVDKHMETYRRSHKINNPLSEFDMAALHDGKCVGGIQCEIYSDAMYISRIVVDPCYRKQRIGSTLIRQAIDHAKGLNLKTIDLGTCEFQGRPFYETFGFKVIHTRDDNPKGYKNYTMIKEL